ncbi:MAG: ATP-binding protein, partial [bacterium]
KNRALIIFGPRRVGKTTLLQNFLKQTNLKFKLDSGDNIKIQTLFSSQDFDKILSYAQGYDLIAIDEAQEIPGIGKALKILVDQVPNLRVIATGSSSFDLKQSVGEPLTGRKTTLTLYPVSQLELKNHFNEYELKQKLEQFLIFGSYPEILSVKSSEEKISLLTDLVDSYLLKDILALDKIKNSETLLSLVKLLAFQIGQLVSLSELATQLKIDVKTVGRYIDLLEKSFVISKLSGFSKNLRNEITKKHKYYFLDLGIRNAVIAQFNDLASRNDIGQLWENFIFTERLKYGAYTGFYGSRYFWRTYQGQEIDFIEEIENKLTAFETKWSTTKKVSTPTAWKDNYPDSSFYKINPENYLDFISKDNKNVE